MASTTISYRLLRFTENEYLCKSHPPLQVFLTTKVSDRILRLTKNGSLCIPPILTVISYEVTKNLLSRPGVVGDGAVRPEAFGARLGSSRQCSREGRPHAARSEAGPGDAGDGTSVGSGDVHVAHRRLHPQTGLLRVININSGLATV